MEGGELFPAGREGSDLASAFQPEMEPLQSGRGRGSLPKDPGRDWEQEREMDEAPLQEGRTEGNCEEEKEDEDEDEDERGRRRSMDQVEGHDQEHNKDEVKSNGDKENLNTQEDKNIIDDGGLLKMEIGETSSNKSPAYRSNIPHGENGPCLSPKREFSNSSPSGLPRALATPNTEAIAKRKLQAVKEENSTSPPSSPRSAKKRSASQISMDLEGSPSELSSPEQDSDKLSVMKPSAWPNSVEKAVGSPATKKSPAASPVSSPGSPNVNVAGDNSIPPSPSSPPAKSNVDRHRDQNREREGSKEERKQEEEKGNGEGNAVVKRAAATPEMEIPKELVTIFNSHQSEVFMCAWNPHKDLLASGSGDSTARIWDLTGDESGKPGTSFVLKHSEQIGDRNKDVTTLQWDGHGKLLATGSYDGVARVWGSDGALQKTLAAHTGPIFSLKWNKEGTHLLSGSYDKSAIIWSLKSGQVVQKFAFHDAPTLDVDWQDNTAFATCSTDKTIHYCALGEESPRRTFKGHSDEVNAIKWNPLGTLLASCSDDGTAKIWTPESDSFVQDLCEHTKEIYTIEWSPTGPGSNNPNKQLILASASFDATVKLWDVENGKAINTLSRNDESVYSVAFSPSGEYLASGSLAGHLCIWNVKDGSLIKTYQGNGDIFEVAWNHREDKLAACYSTNVVTILDFRM